MSSLNTLLNSLPEKYKDSPDALSATLEKIYKYLENENSAKKKNTAIVSAISTICANLNITSNETYKISLKYFQLFIPTLGNDYLSIRLNYIKFFMHYSFQKEKIAEIRNFFINFEIQHDDKLDLLKFCLDLHKVYFSRILFYYQPTEIEVKHFFGNLIIIFQVIEKMFPAHFLQFSEEIFGQRDYIKIIFKHQNESADFLKCYLSIIRSLNNILDLNNFYMYLTKMFIYFLEIETTNRQEFGAYISKSFLTACLNNQEIKKNKSMIYILQIYYYMIKLLSIDDNVQQQLHLKEVLQKYKIFLERNENNEICFMDSIGTFIVETYVLSQYIAKNINKDNCELIFDVMELLLKYIYEIKYSKKMCPDCSSYAKHQIYNLCNISLNFYQRAIELNLPNENIDKFIVKMLTISLECKNKFNCKRADKLLFILIRNCWNYIKEIKSVKRIKYGLVLLDLISNSSELKTIGNICILKLYRQYYQTVQNKKYLIIIQGLLILNLTAEEKYESVNTEMQIFINYLVEANRKAYTLVYDVILDSKYNHLKPATTNRSYIIQKQIEIMALKKIVNNMEMENLIIKYIDEINSNLDFALLVRNLNIINEEILLDKVNNRIKSLTDKLSESKDNLHTVEYHYALAILYKREALQLFDQLKDIFKIKEFSSNSLQELNSKQYDNFNCKIENSALNISIKSIQHFSYILPHLNDENFTKLINWSYLFDDISILARILELRGFFNHSFVAWKLLYNISTDYHICYLQQMRAVSFFCKHYEIVNMLDNNLNLKTIINSLSKHILQKFDVIDSLTPRRQNYILLCMLDIGYFYAKQNDMKSCNALMNMVANKVNKMESRKNKFELVKAKLYGLEFHLVTKFELVLKYSPYCFIQCVLTEIRNIEYITSEDSINIMTFLFNFIQEVAYFLMSVNDMENMIIFVLNITKYALEAGLIFRVIQIFLLWAHMSLELEECQDCQMKLFIVNKLMLIENDLDIEYPLYKNNTNILPYKSVESLNIIPNYLLAREASYILTSPRNTKLELSSKKYSLFKYLNNDPAKCSCIYCKHPIYKMIQFKMGCLFARMYYLNGKTVVAEEFFERSLNWWNQNNSDYFKLLFSNFKIWMIIYYINTLRANKNYYKGNEICKLALDFIKSAPIKFDVGCSWKIIEQKEAIKYSVAKIKSFKTPSKTPRNNKMKPISKALILDSQLNNITSEIEDMQFFNDMQISHVGDELLETDENIITINDTLDIIQTEINKNEILTKQQSCQQRVTRKPNTQVRVLKEQNENNSPIRNKQSDTKKQSETNNIKSRNTRKAKEKL